MNPSPDDHEALELLDAYMAQVQSGGRPDRDGVLRRRPDLESAIELIDRLEGLAPLAKVAAEPVLADDADDAFPRPFGAYELLDEIGRGGMGVVYRARQLALDRVVAVKMILGHHLASADHVRRFQIEARAAARLRHPNIVPIHEVGQCHGQHYFVMEYIKGESLAERLARGPIDVADAVRLLIDIARAVDHLHHENIVHRDLKPSNILVDVEGRPLVTDFGLAKVFEPGSEATTTGVIAGTPSYMAPEQAAGRADEIGPKVDVYSLGAILYEMLTGRPPFRTDNPLDTVMAVLGSEPVAPRQLAPRVPRGLELVCLKCLAKSPAQRYESAGTLANELERFARGEALEVRPPTLARRIGRFARRQPALAMRLGAFAAFYLFEWCNFLGGTGGVTADFHWKITAILALWAAASIGLQQLLDSRWAIPAGFGWSLVDMLMSLAVLLVADGVASPLVVVYPLAIVGSGLWFRVRFVGFTTTAALVSYAVLVADFYLRRPSLADHFDPSFDRHIIFAMALVVEGAAVGYLVDRVRTLSRFCGRPLS